MNICKCGICGQEVKPGNRFIRGHNLHGNKHGAGHIPWNKGKTKKTDARLVIKLAAEVDKKLWPNFCECGCKERCMRKFVHGHNGRGMHTNLGRKRTEEEKRKNSIAHLGKIHKSGKKFLYTLSDNSIVGMRSNWEVMYAQFLDLMRIKWLYEPKGFKLSNGHYYFPDFYIPEFNEWHEVKGWMSPKSIEKIELFKKDYPNEKLTLVRDITYNSLSFFKA